MSKKRKQGQVFDASLENDRETLPPPDEESASEIDEPSTESETKPEVEPEVTAAPSNVVTLSEREFTVNIFIRTKPGELPRTFAITEKATNGMKKRTMKQSAERYAAWLSAPR